MVFSLGENLTCAILAKKAGKIQIVKNFSVYSGDLSFRRFILSCRRGEIREARGIGIKFLRIITPLGYQTNPARAAHYNSTNRLTGTGPGSSLAKHRRIWDFLIAEWRRAADRTLCGLYMYVYVCTHTCVFICFMTSAAVLLHTFMFKEFILEFFEKSKASRGIF